MFKTGRMLLIGGMLLAGLINSGCGGGAAAKAGDVVKVNYTGTLDDGTVFDSSVGREPLEFTVGGGQMIKGFDAAVVGMKVGDKKTVTIPAADAYGERSPQMIIEVDKTEFPEGMKLEVGQRVQGNSTDGNTVIFTIAAVSDTTVTLDANNPLAGQDLTFEIEMVSING